MARLNISIYDITTFMIFYRTMLSLLNMSPLLTTLLISSPNPLLAITIIDSWHPSKFTKTWPFSEYGGVLKCTRSRLRDLLSLSFWYCHVCTLSMITCRFSFCLSFYPPLFVLIYIHCYVWTFPSVTIFVLN